MNSEQVNQYFTEQARTSDVPVQELRKAKTGDPITWELLRYNFDLILRAERDKGGVYA